MQEVTATYAWEVLINGCMSHTYRKGHQPPQGGAVAEDDGDNQFMWQNGWIPRELGWMILFLIPKGDRDTRGIGLL